MSFDSVGGPRAGRLRTESLHILDILNFFETIQKRGLDESIHLETLRASRVRCVESALFGIPFRNSLLAGSGPSSVHAPENATNFWFAGARELARFVIREQSERNAMTEERRLLLVEDDVDQASLVRRWLEKAGYSVVHAAHALDGAALASTRNFNAVITDLYLPHGSGFDVVTASKAADRYRPALVITSDDALETGVHAMKCRADDCVGKPLRRDVLLNKLARILERNESARVANRTRVLAIGAHPDDVEIGCGGALLTHKREGAELVILTLSAGSRGGIATTRGLEAAAAARELGARLILGDLEDTNISAGSATIGKISEVIEGLKPDFLYTHTSSDTHQDHVNVHRASLVAARTVPNVMCYQSPSSTIDFRPNRFVDISPSVDDKLSLIGYHRSQTTKCVYLKDDLILATARYWGRYAGYVEVEPFEVVRQTK